MKKLIFLFITSCAIAFINTAMAGTNQWMDSSTCYVFKNNKLVTKANCQRYNDQGSNSVYPMYGFENYRVKVPKVGIIDVVNSSSCERENACSTTHTVNDKKATSQWRQSSNGYKVVTDKQVEKMSPSSVEKLLQCDKTIDGKLEICTIGSKNYNVPDNFPSWTGYD